MTRDFNNVAEVIEWLNMPQNQFTSDLFVIKWDGYMPRISTTRLVDLNSPRDIGLAACVLQEHKRRKRRPDDLSEDDDNKEEGL